MTSLLAAYAATALIGLAAASGETWWVIHSIRSIRTQPQPSKEDL